MVANSNTNDSQAARSNLRATKWLTMLSPIESGAVQLSSHGVKVMRIVYVSIVSMLTVMILYQRALATQPSRTAFRQMHRKLAPPSCPPCNAKSNFDRQPAIASNQTSTSSHSILSARSTSAPIATRSAGANSISIA